MLVHQRVQKKTCRKSWVSGVVPRIGIRPIDSNSRGVTAFQYGTGTVAVAVWAVWGTGVTGLTNLTHQKLGDLRPVFFFRQLQNKTVGTASHFLLGASLKLGSEESGANPADIPVIC